MKPHVRLSTICLLLIGFLLTGCKVRRPNHIIPEEKMENLLYDYHIAKAMGENLPYNENYKKVLYLDYVFNKYGTDQVVFDSSMVWYTRHADILSKIYEKVNLRLKEEQTELDRLISIRDNKPKISNPGDSIDVWPTERMLYLSHTLLNNKQTFVIPSDSNYQERDTLEWKVWYHLPYAVATDSVCLAVMSMAIQYANDSVISTTKTIFGSGEQTIRLQADTLKSIKEIRGFIYLTEASKANNHLFADQISLIRYHSTDSLFSAKTDSIDAETIEEKEDAEKDKAIQELLTPQPERITPDEMRRNRSRPSQKTISSQEAIKYDVEPLKKVK